MLLRNKAVGSLAHTVKKLDPPRLHEQGEQDAGDKEARFAAGGRQDGDQPDPDVERALQHGEGFCADGARPRGATYWGQAVRETGTTFN